MRDKYDWETRDDARILRQAKEIKRDPARLKKAQECLADELAALASAISDKPLTPPMPSRNDNPATIGRLTDFTRHY